MPADIFCQRLDRNIHTMLEGHEVMNAPGIVHHHHAAGGMRGPRNGRHILHFECVAARAFGIDHLGIGTDERTNTSLINQRIVIGGLNPPILQQAIADIARRAVSGIRHQAMIAGFQIGHQRYCHRRQARTDQHAARAAFNFRNHIFQSILRGTAGGAVGHHAVPFVLLEGAARFGIRVQHGGPAMHGGIDEAMRSRSRAPGMRHACGEALPVFGVVVGHISYSFPFGFQACRPIRSRNHRKSRHHQARPASGQVPGCRR